MTREEAREELITFIGTFECPSLEAVEVAIESLQTDIVRCGECKHYGNEMLGWCYELNRATNADKFCSYGERSEE